MRHFPILYLFITIIIIIIIIIILFIYLLLFGGGGAKLSIMIATLKKNRTKQPSTHPLENKDELRKNQNPKHAMIYLGEIGEVNEKFLSILSKKQLFTT